MENWASAFLGFCVGVPAGIAIVTRWFVKQTDQDPEFRHRLRKSIDAIDSHAGYGYGPSVAELNQQNVRLIAQKDGAYEERDKCVAVIARLAAHLHCVAWLGRHEGGEWDDDWRNIVFVELPTGQVSWHIHDSELPLFAFLKPAATPWDGHDTPEKYRRLLAWGDTFDDSAARDLPCRQHGGRWLGERDRDATPTNESGIAGGTEPAPAETHRR